MYQRVVHAAVSAVLLAGLAVPAATAAGAAEPAAPARPAAARELPRDTRLQVKFKAGTGASKRAEALARVASRGHAVAVERRIAALNASVIRTDDQRAVLRLLRNDANVEYVEPVSRYRALETPSPELVEIGADRVHAPAEPAVPNLGAGTEIAIIDSPIATGASAVPDLDGPGKVFFAHDSAAGPIIVDGPWTDRPCDSFACPHGTGVASVAAAESDDAGMAGVAPAAKIRSYNVFRHYVYDDGFDEWHETLADSAAIADALTRVATYGAENPSLVAVNMSLGGMFDNRLVADAILDVRTRAPQVTVVVAAGNDSKERANFPAGNPQVLSVGATGNIPDDLACTATPAASWTVTAFSNRGDVDVVAPGRCVDAWYPGTSGTTNGSTGSLAIRKVDGTSFAAPMVAGVAAVLGAAGVTGDAARAAIISSATGTPSVAVGAGKATAPAALALATGTAPYTAMSVDRGNQVATSVGSRTVEVIRVDPTKTIPVVDAPTPSVSSGYGAVVQKMFGSPVNGVDRETFTYTVPAAAKPVGAGFSLTANGGAGGDDAITLPMRMLDATNGYEGVPAANGETGTAPLTYGSRSAYIRSAAITSSGVLNYDFTFGEATVQPEMGHPAALYVWEPTSVKGIADAAMEPVWESSTGADHPRSDSDYFAVGGAQPDACYDGTGDPDDDANWRTCRPGRYLVGFVAMYEAATSSSTSRYSLRLRYALPTATLANPPVASATSITGPFTVKWGGTRAEKWDVWYATRTRVGSTWTTSAWKPWRTKTTNKYGVFGLNGSPVTVAPGRTYAFRAVAYDSVGNASPATVRSTTTPLDDRSASITYSTGSLAWTNVSVSDRWLKTAKKTSAVNASARMYAEASQFVIVGDKCSTCGKLKVYVDGVYRATVDTYRSSGTAVRQTLWSSGALSGGTKSRSIKIVVVGTKGRPKVVLDGIAAVR
ncbi:MAG TPA: S8 family serine peptidase [Frankiaceae bacterium]|nr:S8 family serine peptidase [Frankiaceae bacterium]